MAEVLNDLNSVRTIDSRVAGLETGLRNLTETVNRYVETSEAHASKTERQIADVAKAVAAGRAANWPVVFAGVMAALVLMGLLSGGVSTVFFMAQGHTREMQTVVREYTDAYASATNKRIDSNDLRIRDLERVSAERTESMKTTHAELDAHAKRFGELDDKLQKEQRGIEATITERVNGLDAKLQMEFGVNKIEIDHLREWRTRMEKTVP